MQGSFTNYYKLLGVEQNASKEDIEKALRKTTRTWRTRVNSPDLKKRQEAETVLEQLKEAKVIFSDENKRTEYDQRLKAYVDTPVKSSSTDDKFLQNSPSELIETAWELLGKGNVQEAFRVASEAYKKDPNNPQGWSVFAQTASRVGEFDDAIFAYKRAIELQPNQATLHCDLGSTYEGVKRWDDAITQYQLAYDLEPSRTDYYAAIGVAYVNSERYPEGIRILEDCIKKEPNNEGYKESLSSACIDASYKSWIYVAHENAYYATEPEHVLSTQLYLDKLKALDLKDSTKLMAIEGIEEDLKIATKRKFLGLWWVAILGGVTWSLFQGIGTFMAIAYYFASSVPQYRVNKSVLQGKTFESFELSFFGREGTSIIIAYPMIVAFFPLIIMYNFNQNYDPINYLESRIPIEKQDVYKTIKRILTPVYQVLFWICKITLTILGIVFIPFEFVTGFRLGFLREPMFINAVTQTYAFVLVLFILISIFTSITSIFS